MTNKVEPRSLQGFRDVLPPESILKSKLLAKLRSVFESFAYVPLETPHLELTECLLGNTSTEISKQLYRFKDNGDRDVCLRFDLTVPFARAISQHTNILGLPFKRYAIGNVFRGERPQLGRYREFTQCDFDFVGTDCIYADLEIIQVINAALTSLELGTFLIRINNRKLMNAIFAALGLTSQAAEVLRIIDKTDKIGVAEVLETLRKELAIPEAAITEINALLISDDHRKLLETMNFNSETFSEAKTQTLKFCELLDSIGVKTYKLDFSVARGLGYYTGIVYEAILLEHPEVGTVSAGGRYDNLTSTFSKQAMPGVGASVGIDRILAIANKLENLQKSQTTADLFIPVMSDDLYVEVQKKAAELRALGCKVEVYPEAAKLKKQFQYADRKGFAFVLVLGESELQEGKFKLKNMASGTEVTCATLVEVYDIIKNK